MIFSGDLLPHPASALEALRGRDCEDAGGRPHQPSLHGNTNIVLEEFGGLEIYFGIEIKGRRQNFFLLHV